MEYQDYYKILGVDRNADAATIKKRYRILAQKYHPDISKEPNAEEKFKEVKEAYEVLKDPTKRKAYDQMGSQWQAGQSFTPPPGWEFRSTSDGGQEEFNAGAFSEFFENLFGQRVHGQAHRQTYSQPGQDQFSKIPIFLEEAYQGAERIIRLQEPESDQRTGQVRLKTRQIKVKIPAGVTEGQQIRLAHQGMPGRDGGRNGDLYLEIQLVPHPLYTVKDRDIYLSLPVTPWEAALGAKVIVPTLGGKVELNIPAGSQTGRQLRLRGRGLGGKSPGDQYILLVIHIPEPKTPQQRELYEKMANEMPFNPRLELFKEGK